MANNIVAARLSSPASRLGAPSVPPIVFAETAQEQELLDLFRHLSPRNKVAILAAVRTLADMSALATSAKN
ncbi:hypothetical protein J2T07_002716 [Luteibacter jiangsuensis]|uniref:Uncharacterized protein n=1 Tax=Luteibacter jiangsuensis TaxID=637577 RepID=A0ABT9SZT6_9GAMM|nr:hypothetical protein [Luteibacter jiangsuensis]